MGLYPLGAMKRAVVTGASGAIGRAIVDQLIALGYHVIALCRSEERGRLLVREAQEAHPEAKVEYLAADLSLESEIIRVVASISKPLDVLMNNAATTPPQRMESGEGVELQFAVNVLSYLRLTLALLPHLKGSPMARVVNVASSWAGNLDLSDLQFERRAYNNNTAYMQSKQANRMLTSALAEALKRVGIAVNAAHPGEVNSKLSNSLGFGGHESAEKGAETPVWVADSPELQGVTGKWFVYLRQTPCQFNRDEDAIHELYNICLGYCSKELLKVSSLQI